jgi:hypothetical protein
MNQPEYLPSFLVYDLHFDACDTCSHAGRCAVGTTLRETWLKEEEENAPAE